ncbi:unnamed protein product [Ambrosiozyma monospora]|uniref:Unnamed protein product n=1 Tax=Ambrosiozyma monospora TaxID=43982 RepID=A0A9W6YVX4_AMBMO|nr:unnamed protein product [Ambrosiozyma monospora]
MGSAYQLFGKVIQPYQLSLGTLGAVLLLVAPKPWSVKPKLEAKIDASSPEEEKFITEFLAKHEKESH